MGKIHVKVDDNVYVLRGKDAGKSGKVLEVFPKTSQVIVDGINEITKHKKAKSHLEQGGIIKQPGKIHSSNVMVVCPHCKKPVKTGSRIDEKKGIKEKVRYCKRCDATISSVKTLKEANVNG